MRKKILISTGGSGGHVVPASIFYEHLKNEFDVSLVTDRRGIHFLDKKKYDIEIINVRKISKNIFLLPFQIFSFLLMTVKSFFLLKRKKISILISTG
jgi:UDP-N-acetylglucosamine--N-acetylmuramyl-(pentapeptide) pyrophosphoryl-undecaprenol N-acetylglucosamine transferase